MYKYRYSIWVTSPDDPEKEVKAGTFATLELAEAAHRSRGLIKGVAEIRAERISDEAYDLVLQERDDRIKELEKKVYELEYQVLSGGG